MKRFLYLSLTGFMVLSSTSRCMEQIIKADEEAQKLTSTSEVDEETIAKKHGPELPTKEEVITTFLEAAAVVALKGRYSVASSEPFATMKSAYATIKAINKGDKKLTRSDLFDAYCSDDEDYYENGIDNEERTAQKIKAIDGIIAHKIQPKIEANHKESELLKRDKESIDKALTSLYVKRALIAEAIAKNMEEKERLDTVSSIHANSKERENSLLSSRAEAILEEIKAIDERIRMHKDEALATLDIKLDESIVAERIKDQVDVEVGLLEEKQKLQEKLNKINEIIAKINETPKTGWFSLVAW